MAYPTVQTEPASCVLIVDDQEPNRGLLEEIPIDNGFRVVTASNGEEALRILEKMQIDLVLLDVIMPGRNGFEVCREINSNPLMYLSRSCLLPPYRIKRAANKAF